MSQRPSPRAGGSQFQQQLQAGSPRGLQFEEGEEKKEDGGGDGGGTATGLANYEATLSKWLGSKLYAAVSDQPTLDKLSGHASSAVKSALSPLGGYIKEADPDADPAEVDKAVKAMKAALGKAAAGYVKANGKGLQKALQGFVDANPELIVLIALLAAAGAVAANMKIPDLKKTLGITDELDLTLTARLGKIRNIALEQIKAELKYKSGAVKASASVVLSDDDLSAVLALRYGLRDDLDLTARATWGDDDGFGGRLGMEYKPTDRLSIGAHVGYDDDQGANAGVGVTFRF
jgi:hypothetical protein